MKIISSLIIIAASVLVTPAATLAEDHQSALMTCKKLKAVDGDTVKCDGQNLRDMGSGAPDISGYDTPEIWSNKCDFELELARKAKKRMAVLLKTPGLKIYDSGQVDDTEEHRPLVWIIMPDGRTVGDILMSEGLARIWLPDHKNDWCTGNS